MTCKFFIWMCIGWKKVAMVLYSCSTVNLKISEEPCGVHIFPFRLFLLVKHRGWTAVTQHFGVSIRASLFPLSADTSGDSEWLPSQRPALSSSQFNKTAPFMLVGFSSGNGFPQWVSLFLQVSHFSLCTAGPLSRSDLWPLTLIS